MQKIAVLGAAGTFSDNAAKTYINTLEHGMEKIFYPSINDVFHAVEKEGYCGIIPVENTLDGFVQKSLDLLLETKVTVVREIIVPVQFSLIANTKDINDIKKLYVQFKTNGQCRSFIDSLHDVKIITTEDNMTSYDMAMKNVYGDSAIIPQHLYEKTNTQFGIKNITDADNNHTRFFVIKPDFLHIIPKKFTNIRTAIFIVPSSDRPGLLYEILGDFYLNKINIVSIMSRPTRKNMGTYNFYIELSSNYEEIEIINKTIANIQHKNFVKILGMYGI